MNKKQSQNSTVKSSKTLTWQEEFIDNWLPTITIVSTILGGIITAFFNDFLKPDNNHDNILMQLKAITILVVLIAATLLLERKKATKQLERYITQAEEDFKKIKESSSLLKSLLAVSDENARELLIKITNAYVALEKLKISLDENALKIIEDQINEQIQEYMALTKGHMDMPMREAPNANKRLIEVFNNRMDAVSDRDVEFWLEAAGEKYFKDTIQAVGNKKTKRTEVTRIFIIEDEYFIDKDKLKSMVKILSRHIRNNVGFAVVISSGIKEHRKKLSNLKFDFALFDENKAITFFRKEIFRFLAYLYTLKEDHNNNLLINSHRDLWVQLINESWIVSVEFISSINKTLKPDEKQKIEVSTQNDNKDLSDKTGFEAEDLYFPFKIDYMYNQKKNLLYQTGKEHLLEKEIEDEINKKILTASTEEKTKIRKDISNQFKEKMIEKLEAEMLDKLQRSYSLFKSKNDVYKS